MKKYAIFILSVFMIFAVNKQVIAQQTEDAQRAEWIFNIAYGVTWENEADITSYTIGVFSSKSIFNELQKQAATKKIKGKPVKIIRYLNYKDIQANHIVYVSKNENAYLGFVYQKLKGKNVLIMSDCSKQPEYSVLNFRKTDKKSVKPFDINYRLAEQNHIKFSTQLLKLGGDRKELKKMYFETNKNFLELKNEIENKKQESKAKDQEILKLKKEIERLKQENIKLKEQSGKGK